MTDTKDKPRKMNVTHGGPRPGYPFRHTGTAKEIEYAKYGGKYVRSTEADGQGRILWKWQQERGAK